MSSYFEKLAATRAGQDAEEAQADAERAARYELEGRDRAREVAAIMAANEKLRHMIADAAAFLAESTQDIDTLYSSWRDGGQFERGRQGWTLKRSPDFGRRLIVPAFLTQDDQPQLIWARQSNDPRTPEVAYGKAPAEVVSYFDSIEHGYDVRPSELTSRVFRDTYDIGREERERRLYSHQPSNQPLLLVDALGNISQYYHESYHVEGDPRSNYTILPFEEAFEDAVVQRALHDR